MLVLYFYSVKGVRIYFDIYRIGFSFTVLYIGIYLRLASFLRFSIIYSSCSLSNFLTKEIYSLFYCIFYFIYWLPISFYFYSSWCLILECSFYSYFMPWSYYYFNYAFLYFDLINSSWSYLSSILFTNSSLEFISSF